MSNNFLDYGSGGGDLSALKNGTFDVNAATLRDQSLVPGLPVAADANKKLITRLVGLADLSFTPLSNPLNDDLHVNGEVFADNVVSGGLDLNLFATQTANGISALNAKTLAIAHNGIDLTTITGTLLAQSIRATSIVDALTATELLNIDEDSVDVFSQKFTFNGVDVATVNDLDDITLGSAGGNSLVADGAGPALSIKGLTAGPGIEVDDTGTALEVSYDDTRLLAVETQVQNISAASLTTSIAGSLSIGDALEPGPSLPAMVTPYTATAVLGGPALSYGGRWNATEDITITGVGIAAVLWVPQHDQTPRSFRIYAEGNTTALYEFIVPRANLVGNDFVYQLPTPIALPAGTYRHAVDTATGQYYQGNLEANPKVFDPRITGAQAVQSFVVGVYPQELAVTTAKVWHQGNIYLADGVQGTLSINDTTVSSAGGNLLAMVGGVGYGLAGPRYAAGGRWNPVAGGLLYADGAGFRLYWEPVRDQLQYEIDSNPWWGSTSVCRSSTTNTEGKADIEADSGVNAFALGQFYYFSSGLTTTDDKQDLNVGRTVRITICSADSSSPGAPLIEITAMRTNTVVLWTLRRNSWDVGTQP